VPDLSLSLSLVSPEFSSTTSSFVDVVVAPARDGGIDLSLAWIARLPFAAPRSCVRFSPVPVVFLLEGPDLYLVESRAILKVGILSALRKELL